ncbi:unnamed protein product [Caenorhabditis angaria]|uniref:Uncharacterized protein n=1 Tax=Caenorhabditis angaria TaxID=860376 RepID=A0A9P1IJF5_9PELO|nr:unnamed protein product [Caenorhabditis angaria]
MCIFERGSGFEYNWREIGRKHLARESTIASMYFRICSAGLSFFGLSLKILREKSDF